MRVARLVLSIVLILSSSLRLNSQQPTSTVQRDPEPLAIVEQMAVAAGWETDALPPIIIASGTLDQRQTESFTLKQRVELTLSSAPIQDVQAVSLLTKSVQTMGGVVPAATVASGTAQIVIGSLSELGTARILTRSFDQTREEIQAVKTHSVAVFSRGSIGEGPSYPPPEAHLELSATGPCPDFPLAVFAAALANPDSSIQYVAAEYAENTSFHHIRLWNSFASRPKLSFLAALSIQDIWIDAISLLPVRIAFSRRPGRGSTPSIPVSVSFADYQPTAGVLYPHRIIKSINGTQWATISIDSVLVSTSLSDSDFAIR